jgi:hypothetical protein
MAGLKFVAGSGRSGTTWVLDALAIANGLRPVFEPLNPWASPTGERYAHRAIAPGDRHPELLEFFLDVCAGRGQRLWTQYRRQPRWLFPPPSRLRSIDDASRLWRAWLKFLGEVPQLTRMAFRDEPIVKCIWSNLMLGWLSRNLPCAVVLVVRHPGAVIESEMRSAWSATPALERFRTDQRLADLSAGRYEALLRRSLSPVEALATRWVVENQLAMESAASNGVTVVHYEHLKSAPETAWQRVTQALGLVNAPDRSVLARPSQQAAPKGSDTRADVDVPRWRTGLTPTHKDEIQGVLDQAGCATYSMESVEPQVEP